MEKENIQNKLIEIGRIIVKEKGVQALTARKLAEASNYSVGAIYSQFTNMDNYILVQNYLTLDELSQKLNAVKKSENPFIDMNEFLQVFVDFVLENNNLWYMLYNFHLNNNRQFSFYYLRKVAGLISKVNSYIENLVPNIAAPERLVSAQVLWLALFSMSAFLTNESLEGFSKVNKSSICRLLLNTYIAGLTILESKA